MNKRKSLMMMEQSWSENAGQRVLFIPDHRILSHKTPEECLAEFQTGWGAATDAPTVCLPLVGVDGVAFENRLCPTVPITAKVGLAKAEQRALGEIARDFVDLGCRLHLYVCPAMEFLQVEACHVLDIRNMGAPQACVQKRKTRDFLKYLIGAGIEHVAEHLTKPADSLQGLVVDITDLWGMSGEEGKLSLCCFCDECRVAFESRGVRVSDFENYPNPWYLALKDSGRAISYIDNISHGETATSIVGKAALRGFDTVFQNPGEKLRAASELMKFMTSRHEMVEDFLADVFDEAYVGDSATNAPHLRRIAIVEGSEYDWTAGVFPSSLKSTIVDEIWLDPSDKFPVIPLPYKTFMWRRATYFLNAFFEILSNAADTRMRTTTALARLSLGEMKDLLCQRGAMALNNQLTGLGQIAALSGTEESTRDGIVGVVFTQMLLDDLMRNPEIAVGREEQEDDRGAQLGALGKLFSSMGLAKEEYEE